MSFTIKLYKNGSDNRKLDKSLTPQEGYPLPGTLRDESDMILPTILIEGDKEINQYNYCYIAQFHRYYFITGIKSIRNDLWEITCFVDVLYTYRDKIKNLDAIVIKQQDVKNEQLDKQNSLTNKMLVDGTYKVAADTATELLYFQDGNDDDLIKSTTPWYVVTCI